MRLVMEYLGLTLLSVMVAGALLYAFVSGPESGLLQAGRLAEQEASALSRLGTGQTYEKEQMDQRVQFSYEEKIYYAGEYENLAERFTATDPQGKQLTVQLEEVISGEGETCSVDGVGTIFPGEGVYAVYVSAGGTCYKVSVPVAEAGSKEE